MTAARGSHAVRAISIADPRQSVAPQAHGDAVLVRTSILSVPVQSQEPFDHALERIGSFLKQGSN
jgi:hypothetical protein